MNPIRSTIISLAIAASAAACAGSPDDAAPATRAQCQRLYERVVDLQLGIDANDVAPVPPDIQQHRKNLAATVDDRFLESCTEQRTQAYIRCAMSSTTLEDLGACDVEKVSLATRTGE